mmetsp:Transcript_119665/g.381907  ORF Transcript_119665/g.381907 Transcript_119665/m.381907 type:complete len:201 (-) Transcript_119665:343-945(-)
MWRETPSGSPAVARPRNEFSALAQPPRRSPSTCKPVSVPCGRPSAPSRRASVPVAECRRASSRTAPRSRTSCLRRPPASPTDSLPSMSASPPSRRRSRRSAPWHRTPGRCRGTAPLQRRSRHFLRTRTRRLCSAGRTGGGLCPTSVSGGGRACSTWRLCRCLCRAFHRFRQLRPLSRLRPCKASSRALPRNSAAPSMADC